MPSTGDSFITTLKQAHLEWGNHRHTLSRGIVYGEGYLQIPAFIARDFDITNSNSQNNNIYTCSSSDGFLTNVQLKSTGCSRAGSIHAKQFHGSRNLKLLGSWYAHINAQIGDKIRIDFISPTEILITKI
ncbi:hypothetical protein JET18_05555 [Chryseobacterium sp. L7]|uniref:Uncharacterized protein n=1 Tax=Chryseobacterium endalhagicum TaxID=2797638 RepID=A0ABS1QCF4_9FLAO|nr:hypothetical protein [Chryseobacterium endalhagicum]MBL1220293.1 hypothetical protein [Chryseobacterium endalhagicum]